MTEFTQCTHVLKSAVQMHSHGHYADTLTLLISVLPELWKNCVQLLRMLVIAPYLVTTYVGTHN